MSEWVETTLGELVDIRVSNVDKKSVAGETPVRLCNYMDVYASGALTNSSPFMQATASRAEIERFGLRAGDVLITKDSESPDDIAVPAYIESARPDLVCGYHLALLRPRETVDGRFLSFLLQLETVNRHFAKTATGSTRYGLSIGSIQRAPVKVPTCKGEQRRIAELLSAVDEQIAQAELGLEKQSILRSGIVRDALARMTEAPRESLAQLANVGSGITLGRRFAGPGTSEYPYLRVANVQDGHIDLSDVKTLRLPESVAAKAVLEPGDVLMNEGGDFDKLGRGAVWHGQIPNCLHQNHVFRVRCNQELLLPEFLALWAASEFGKKFFMLASKQSTNLASINSTQLKKFPVLRPTLERQREVLQVVGAVDALLKVERDELAKLRLLKQGLAQSLLSSDS